MEQTRVVLVDDHPIVRQGLRQLLASDPEIALVGEASTGAEALRFVQDMAPDVLLLDIELPDMNGLEVVRRMRELHSPVCVLVFSAYDDAEYVSGLIHAGVTGYILKDELSEGLLTAIREVSRGKEGWLSRRIAEKLMHLEADGPSAFHLTARQVDILKLIVAGQSNQQISQTLDISEKTVEKHLTSLFRDLHVTSRLEAAMLAVRKNLVS